MCEPGSLNRPEMCPHVSSDTVSEITGAHSQGKHAGAQEGLFGLLDCRLADASYADVMPAAKSLLQTSVV